MYKIVPMVCGLSVVLLASAVSMTRAQQPGGAKMPGMGITKGPLAPDIVPDALWDGRKIVAFHALDLPKMVNAEDADAFITDAEYVLGVTIAGQSRAYPSRFIGWHHIINDKVTLPDGSDRWYAVTYCSVCNTGIRYGLSVDGKPVKLDFYGMYNGVVTLCDRDTESVFLQVSGRYISGPLLGKELAVEPVLDTTWGEWKRLHPETLLMSPDTEYSAHYGTKGARVQRGNTRFGMPVFQASLTRADARLARFDKVLGVSVSPLASPASPVLTAANASDAKGGDTARTGTTENMLRRAYPIKALTDAGGVVNDMLGGRPTAIFLDPATVSACAVSRLQGGRTLTFEARKTKDGTVAYYDKETGTRWSIEGRGEEGPLAGKSLDRLDAHLSQWYGWYAYYPQTTIYGLSDAPRPVDPAETPAEQTPVPNSEKKP